MRLLVLLMLCSSAPALAAEQFDLACQGTRVSRRDGPPEPYAFRLRVDLAGKRWCTDACERPADISEVKPDQIVLADDLTYNTRTDFSNSVTLDRKSNAFHQLSSQDRPEVTYLKVEAACTEQPFTAIPKPAPPELPGPDGIRSNR